MLCKSQAPQVDSWIWGIEKIVWGYDKSHQYTFKVLAPKKGRIGCLSLQYHHEKSETWLVYSGIAWGMFVVNNQVCTRIMRAGDIQNIPCGVIHRLMAVSDDLQVLEPSTPDLHAADKSVKKDVVRLHCVHGRECEVARDDIEAGIIAKCSETTNAAIIAIEAGKIPEEINTDYLEGSAFSLSALKSQ